MNFLSLENYYVFHEIDWKNDLIYLLIEDNYVCFKWSGDVTFYNDFDDLLGDIVGYNHDIEIEMLSELSSNYLTYFGYDGDFVIEHIVQMIYDDRYILSQEI